MLHLKRAPPLLIPAQFGFSGTFQESYLCSAYSTLSLPVLGRQGLSLKVHLLLPRPVLPLTGGGLVP